ncbi:response regulator transcription factor [Georgenia wangjunii]|uniref:response regulator transcription factor n=1 Tax=Georgenia wangjunii TaxID=3117730 RepID=UPI002F26C640
MRHVLDASPAETPLSARELDVLRLVAAGRTNRQIGAALFIGEATVKAHLQHVFAKLGAADRAAAVAAGYRRELL